MKLELREVKERGNPEERIVLIANEDCNLGYYFIFNTHRIQDKISRSVKHPYWPPMTQVKKGDLVVLYSKTGASSFKVNDDKTTSYFYYRNLSSAILNNDSIVLVVEVSTWQAEKF